MADIEKLKRALVNADKAGDVAAATALAKALREQMQAAEQPDQTPKGGVGSFIGALTDSIAQGMTFNLSDEIAAGLSTGFGFAGDYDNALQAERDRMAANREANPGTALIGEIGGALATGAGLIKAGASLVPRFANAGLKTRIGAGAAEGAAYGAAYGAGGATGGAVDRAEGAVSGALFGGAVGGAVPVAGAALRGAGEAAYNAIAPRVRGVLDPSGEAARRVGEAFKRDAQMKQFPLSKTDEAAGLVPGQDVRNFDRGGETVRALGRSIANQSPESRGVMQRVIGDRFEGQAARLKYKIEDIVGGKVDDLAFQDALLSRASRENKTAYDAAFAQNFGPQHSMKFDEIAQRVPAEAMRNALRVAKAEGRPFGEQLVASIDDAANTVVFRRTPSIREWHYIQRGLRSAADTAYRGGAGEVGTAYKALHKELLSAMDVANPAYQNARQGAAKFFQADDALEAGRKYVTQNKDIRQATAALGRMKPSEKEAFKIGFTGELMERIGQTSERRNIINQIFSTPNAKAKIDSVLGPKAARELESFVKVETAVDMMRGAMGNSTTARQLVELGLGAGAGYSYSGDLSGAVAGAALAKGLRIAGVKAEENVLRGVAKILLSPNRSELAAAAKSLAKSREYQRVLDQVMDVIETAGRTGGAMQVATQQ